MRLKTSQAGDTIVEVILAMSLLSMILFIAWGTTNRATQISTNARRRVVMVNALKEQAEILKSNYRTSGGKAAPLTGTFGAVTGLNADPCADDMRASTVSSFHYKTDDDLVPQTSGYKTVDDDSSRVWIQFINDASPQSKYVDFYVRGCWVANGGTQNLDSSQFIVRLNK